MKRFLLFVIVMGIGISALQAQSQIDEAKAKFIYNFTNFFEWPKEQRSGDFVIGVLGASDVFYELEDFTKGKKVILQSIAVEKFSSRKKVSQCHILFVGEGYTNNIPSLKKKTGKNTLVISDDKEGISKGAALNFLLKGNRLKYEFAASNAMNQGLKFSSRIRDMAARNY